MPNPNRTPRWQRSSFCGTNACIEVAQIGLREPLILIRDSTDRSAVLNVTPDDFGAFVAGVKAGEFDYLLARE